MEGYIIEHWYFFIDSCGGTINSFYQKKLTLFHPLYVIAGFVLFGLQLILLYRISFKKRGFALREKDIIYKSGVIAETTIIIPLNRIQHVALNEGAFSRLFGLASLEIYTAGGDNGNMSIAGIETEKAKNINESLIKRLDLLANTTTEL